MEITYREELRGKVDVLLGSVSESFSKPSEAPTYKGELANLFTECVRNQGKLPHDFLPVMQEAMTEIETASDVMVCLSRLLTLLDAKPSVPLMPTPDVAEAMAVESETGQEDIKAKDTDVAESMAAETETTQEWRWVRHKAIKPNEDDLRAMRTALESISEHYSQKGDKEKGMYTLQVDDGQPSLVTFKKDGNICLFLRHVFLYVSISNGVFVDWMYNLDRSDNRRVLPFLNKAGEETRHEFGVQLATIGDRQLGMLEAYYTSHHRNIPNTINQRKLPWIILVGATEQQALQSPVVKCQPRDISLKDYLVKVYNRFVPRIAILPTPLDEFQSTHSETPKRKSHKTQKKLLTFRALDLKVDEKMAKFIKYLDEVHSEETCNWFLDRVLHEEQRQTLLLAAMDAGEKKADHDDLEPMHQTCRSREAKATCGQNPCKHDECPYENCPKCPILLRTHSYLLGLADTKDASGVAKSPAQEHEDTIKVHPHRDTTQVLTIQGKLARIRQFLKYYLVQIHDWLGRDQMGNIQPILPAVFLSRHLPTVLRKWHTDESRSGLSRAYKAEVINLINVFLETTKQRFVMERVPHEAKVRATYIDLTGKDLKDGARIRKELLDRVKDNREALAAYGKNVAGPGPTVHNQTNTELPSTVKGKSPPLDRVRLAYDFYHEGYWNKVSRGGKDAHVYIQQVLLLSFVMLLMGARSGMLSHLAFGTNLKTLGMLEKETGSHQRSSTPKKKLTDREKTEEKVRMYAKAYPTLYKKETADRMGDRSFESKYYVVLLALCKGWYGYKNGHINSRIVPFHRGMSVKIIDYSAALLCLRSSEVSVVAVEQARQYLMSRHESDSMEKALGWLEINRPDAFMAVREYLESIGSDAGCRAGFSGAAQVLKWLEKNNHKESARLARQSLTQNSLNEAFNWLEHNGKVDFIKIVYKELGPVRVFYRSSEGRVEGDLSTGDFYGSHAINLRGSKESAKREKTHAEWVTTLFQKAMTTFYEHCVDLGEKSPIQPETAYDDTLNLDELPRQGKMYTLRGVRKATADYIKRKCPHMPDPMKKMLIEHTLMHTLTTHNTVYMKDDCYLRCVEFRSWVERDMPMDEWEDVKEKTKYQMSANDKVSSHLPDVCFGSDYKGPSVQRKKKTADNSDYNSAGDSSSDDEGAQASVKKPKRRKAAVRATTSGGKAATADDMSVSAGGGGGPSDAISVPSDEAAGGSGKPASAPKKKRKKEDEGDEEEEHEEDDMSQTTPISSQSKRTRGDKFAQVRVSLFKDVGFGADRLVKIDCCTYRVRERKEPDARGSAPTGGYVHLLWESCPESKSKCSNKHTADMTLNDATAKSYFDLEWLRFISSAGNEELWNEKRLNHPMTEA